MAFEKIASASARPITTRATITTTPKAVVFVIEARQARIGEHARVVVQAHGIKTPLSGFQLWKPGEGDPDGDYQQQEVEGDQSQDEGVAQRCLALVDDFPATAQRWSGGVHGSSERGPTRGSGPASGQWEGW